MITFSQFRIVLLQLKCCCFPNRIDYIGVHCVTFCNCVSVLPPTLTFHEGTKTYRNQTHLLIHSSLLLRVSSDVLANSFACLYPLKCLQVYRISGCWMKHYRLVSSGPNQPPFLLIVSIRRRRISNMQGTFGATRGQFSMIDWLWTLLGLWLARE